jgi:hypothetical protein
VTLVALKSVPSVHTYYLYPDYQMLQTQNFSACVVVDGRELEGHKIEYSKNGEATCWIASEAGKVGATFCPSIRKACTGDLTVNV